ncbi:MAG: cation:dicarboxylase symporter family transporter [Pirellulales bacterium]
MHAVLLLVILRIFSSHRPLQFLSDMLQAIVTSISTGSSSATLPVTLQCAEENADFANDYSLCGTAGGNRVNMNGTALYEGRRNTISPSLGIELSVGELVVVMLGDPGCVVVKWHSRSGPCDHGDGTRSGGPAN